MRRLERALIVMHCARERSAYVAHQLGDLEAVGEHVEMAGHEGTGQGSGASRAIVSRMLRITRDDPTSSHRSSKCGITVSTHRGTTQYSPEGSTEHQIVEWQWISSGSG